MFTLFHGSDLGSSRQSLTKYLSEFPQESRTVWRTEDTTPEGLRSFTQSPSLFGDRRILVLEGIVGKALQGILAEIVLPDDLQVVIWVPEKLKNTDPLIALMAKNGKVYASNEKKEDEIFQLLGLVAGRKKWEAQGFFLSMMERGSDPFYVFSMFVWQFRLLLGLSLDAESSGKLHPFVKRKALQDLKNWDSASLLAAHRALLDLDLKMKSGGLPRDLLLSEFLSAIL